jgi:hypothetical protein
MCPPKLGPLPSTKNHRESISLPQGLFEGILKVSFQIFEKNSIGL